MRVITRTTTKRLTRRPRVAATPSLARRRRVPGLLRLGSHELAAAVAPRVADHLIAQIDAVGEERLRAELADAECWATCRHDPLFPVGLREAERLGTDWVRATGILALVGKRVVTGEAVRLPELEDELAATVSAHS